MRRKQRVEVADVISAARPQLPLHTLSLAQRRVLQAIESCRTARLGAHVNECGKCGHREQSYNSCWNRHCPKCRGGKVFDWVEARAAELLPVAYSHVVFTLPSELRQLCYYNKRVVYDILFQASSEALQAVAERHLGAKLGFFGVLHSWNQELQYHPHAHFVVPSGGLSPDNSAWVRPKSSRFFLPVRALSKVFRGKFLSALRAKAGELRFCGRLRHLEDPRELNRLLARAARHEWVVYAKKPFAGPECVIKYLANYPHRVAISNHRLRGLTPEAVSFMARDRKIKGKKRLRKLAPAEFVRRFLLHLIPRGYRRIRYYGFLATNRRASELVRCRALLAATPLPEPASSPPRRCPKCTSDLYRVTLVLKPHRICRQVTARSNPPGQPAGPPACCPPMSLPPLTNAA